MRDVYRPEEADLVVPAMQPVIEKILRQQQQQPIGENIGDRQPMVLIAHGEDQEIDAAEEKIDPAVEQHQVAVRQRIPDRIGLLMLPIVTKQEFKPNDDQIDGRTDENEYLFPEVFHGLKINEITHLCRVVLLSRS